MQGPQFLSHEQPSFCRYALIVKTVIAWVCLVIPAAHATDGPVVFSAKVRPNIIVFLVDDMGLMDTSVPFLTDADGRPQRYPLNDFYRTPAMERLAAQGVRFNNFCAMSVCSPTRISLLTGQNAARHGTTNWINPDQDNRGPHGPPDWNWQGLNSDDITLARLLRESGYRTIHVGKGHFGPRTAVGADPLNLGFDRNVGGCSIGAPATYFGEKNYGNGPVPASHAVPGLEKYHGTPTFLTDALTMEALASVDEAIDRHEPFFLYLAHYAVHSPFNSDPRFAEHYAASGQTPPAQAFATLIEGMDKSLGDVLDHLQKREVADHTLILFLGDNGSDAPLGHEHAVACAAPLRGRKGSHYEGGMRVPMIAAWAQINSESVLQREWRISQNGIQDQLASVCDVFPTILELTGTRPPASHQIDGQSLKTLLSGADDPEHSQEFLMHYPHAPHRSDYFTTLRAGPWKVVYHYFPGEDSDGKRYQLFNLQNDPFESNDLASAEPEILREMMGKLVESLKAHHARMPVAKDGKERLVPVVP